MTRTGSGHQHQHAFPDFDARRQRGLSLISRRGMLTASLSGLGGLSLPRLVEARGGVGPATNHRSVILLWMTGGPSHIDTWDPKPTRPLENRGPFDVIPTSVPGLSICEHLPLQAAMMDRFTVLRSVDATGSNHEPNRVFQTGHTEAAPRVNPRGDRFPAIGSVIARERGANDPSMPPYVAFRKSNSHIAFAGDLGRRFDPFIGNDASDLPVYDLVGKDLGTTSGAQMFQLSTGLDQLRLDSRRRLQADLDRLRGDIDASGSMQALSTFQQQAVDLLVGRKAQQAFDLSRESDEMRARYGPHLWCQQALLARRLVEAGVSFVTLDLSYHTASGTWDTHGDNIPPYGGIEKGLKPLLPLFDHLLTTLVTDLEQRNLLDEVLVIAMGEFGRTPNLGTQGSTDGRNHWPVVMSMCLAGGGLRHGQVIGSTEHDGGHIKDRPIKPGDLAATIYRHMNVDLQTTYLDPRGRPQYVIQDGQPIAELF